MKPEVILGDLLESDAQYICHQCNCITTRSAGTAFDIFNKFPYANIYKNRKEWDTVGTIKICGNGKDQRYIINMLAQVYPGKSRYQDSYKDGFSARENYFQKCLELIAEIKELNSLAFPYRIGCNLAGGNWEHYYKMISDFADKIEAKVYIYQLES